MRKMSVRAPCWGAGAILSDSGGGDKPVILSFHLFHSVTAPFFLALGEMITDNYHIRSHKYAPLTLLSEFE